MSDAAPSAPRRRRRAILLIALAVLVVLALIPWLSRGHSEVPAHGTPGTPTQWRLEVASLQIDAPLMAIQATNIDTLDPPANPREVGWWARSAKPGAATGRTIVTGHTVHTGGGQMDHLGSLKPGATILIHAENRTLTYRATQVFTLSKGDVDLRANELFGQTSEKNLLVLVTCSGWTGHGYLSNVFVYATPVDATSAA